MATSAGAAEQAVAIAAAAGTGSLIKNTAPFQQLRLGPKWNRRSGRQGGGAKEAAEHRGGYQDTAGDLDYPVRSLLNFLQTLSHAHTHTRTYTHFQISQPTK